MKQVIDAYSHVGSPRYGALKDALDNMKRWGIGKSVLVLAKTVPDFGALFDGIRMHPDTVRGIGIPFGASSAQREALAELQLQAGVLGLRMEPEETLGNPRIVERLGAAGRWIFAIHPFGSPELTAAYLDWLEHFPQGRIAAPHLLVAESRLEELSGNPYMEKLLQHPRFYAIFSRHGGVGSKEAYPHRDLLPWVSYVLKHAGTERVMWGSEFPVIYSRNESMPQCQEWLSELHPDLTADQLQAMMHDNAERVFFSEPAEVPADVPLPGWIREQFDHKQFVWVYTQDPVKVPVYLYDRLLTGYLKSEELQRGDGFSQYIINKLETVLMD
ncbi:amidohydrolase family protein [Paenibacillus sp. TAB 01]|uniref:amidohydrolase family protein n=1 Tax=Paenibacillus sp. TAB 01 TaxID=3368988 RepID=UPI003750901F